MPLPLRLLAIALVAVVTTAVASAQRPPSWVPAPAPAVAPVAVQHLGKILWFTDAGTLHAFSAATRTWASFPVTGNATIRNTNDWLLVVDGPIIAAMSSARGRFDVLPVSAQAQVINPTTARNDGIALVLDGSVLWAFSGFAGRWTSRTVAPTALITVQRNVAIIADGRQVWAMSAVFGDWVPRTTGFPVSAVGAGDTAGWATDGVDAHGFSAIRNAWASHPIPTGAQAQPQTGRDVAVWAGTGAVLAFSGVRGAFDQVTTGQQVPVMLADHLAYAPGSGGLQHFLFSAPNARWTTFSTATAASAQLAEAVALLSESGRVHAFSALTSTVASQTARAPISALNAAVAATVDPTTGDLHLFSAMTGAWSPAPVGANPSLPQLARNGALLRDVPGTTAWAFAARSGRFVARPLGGTPGLHVDGGSSLLAIEDDTALAVFEPRREVWLDTPITAAERPLDLRIWRTTLCAFTPTDGIGYSPMHGVIERTALPGPLIEPRASSEVGAAITTAGVVAWSSVSDLRTEAQFPEFRRMFGRGSRLDLEATGAAGAMVGAVGGFAGATATVIPGVGELVLEAGSLVPVSLGALDGDGLATLRLPVPDDPALRGFELACQAVVLPTGGVPYLTRACSFRIH